MKTANGFEIIQLFEQFSPKRLAVEGDKIGLQIGGLSKKINRVLVTLDVLENVIDEAIKKDVQLIIAHHPPLFRPLKTINTDTVQGRMIEKLLRHGIAVYAAHTNLDIAKGGINDWLAEAVGLKETEVLFPTYEAPLKKLVVYVPLENAKEVRQALGSAGAGHLGNYSNCSFSAKGKGRFLPEENTNPFIGKEGVLEKVDEVRIETIVPETQLKKAVAAMLKAHPYEEVAYDIYPVENKGEILGLGRIGKIAEMTLKELAEQVKSSLDVKGVRVVGDLNAIVRKVAILGGDGNKYIHQAKRMGADVYITGDIYYHTAHDAMMEGLNLIDPGHNVERIMKKGVVEVMGKMCREAGFDTEFLVSEENTEPFQFI